jgi:hypothetical protein
MESSNFSRSFHLPSTVRAPLLHGWSPLCSLSHVRVSLTRAVAHLATNSKAAAARAAESNELRRETDYAARSADTLIGFLQFTRTIHSTKL